MVVGGWCGGRHALAMSVLGRLVTSKKRYVREKEEGWCRLSEKIISMRRAAGCVLDVWIAEVGWDLGF
jgi:hypothetical protein